MIAASLLLMVFALNSGISRIEGLTLFVCLILFTTISIKKGRTQQQEADIDNQEGKPMTILAAVGLIALSCAMLAFGADILVDGATSLASAMGVSDKVIGLTIVALGTSLPELAASVAAAIKKQMDISIGNVIGSNIFNILCVLGVSGSIRPIALEYAQYNVDFIIMLAFAVGLLFLIQPWKPQGKLGRLSGLLLFAAYAVYAWSLF